MALNFNFGLATALDVASGEALQEMRRRNILQAEADFYNKQRSDQQTDWSARFKKERTARMDDWQTQFAAADTALIEAEQRAIIAQQQDPNFMRQQAFQEGLPIVLQGLEFLDPQAQYEVMQNYGMQYTGVPGGGAGLSEPYSLENQQAQAQAEAIMQARADGSISPQEAQNLYNMYGYGNDPAAITRAQDEKQRALQITALENEQKQLSDMIQQGMQANYGKIDENLLARFNEVTQQLNALSGIKSHPIQKPAEPEFTFTIPGVNPDNEKQHLKNIKIALGEQSIEDVGKELSQDYFEKGYPKDQAYTMASNDIVKALQSGSPKRTSGQVVTQRGYKDLFQTTKNIYETLGRLLQSGYNAIDNLGQSIESVNPPINQFVNQTAKNMQRGGYLSGQFDPLLNSFRQGIPEYPLSEREIVLMDLREKIEAGVSNEELLINLEDYYLSKQNSPQIAKLNAETILKEAYSNYINMQQLGIPSQ